MLERTVVQDVEIFTNKALAKALCIKDFTLQN